MNKSILVPLTPDQVSQGFSNIGYNQTQLSEDVKAIRVWLEEQEYLPPSRFKEEDCFIKQFLMGCKGSIERTKQKLDMYYLFKSSDSVLVKNFDPLSDDVIAVSNSLHCCILPQALPNGTRVYYARIYADKFNGDFIAVFKRVVYMIEVLMRLEGLSTCSYIAVTDVKGLGAETLARLSPSLTKDALTLLQEGLPFRIKKFVFVNAPSFFDITINYLLKPFLSKKLSERVLVTSAGLESLTELIPEKVMPNDFGGGSESVATISGQWLSLLTSMRDLFLNEWRETIDKSKRPAKIRDSENPYFGLHGSIKKLSVD